MGNPRRIKRLLNAYWVRASIAASRGLDFEVPAFAKLVLLEEVYPDDFGTVLSWLSAGTLEDQIERLEAGDGEFPPHLTRWGQSGSTDRNSRHRWLSRARGRVDWHHGLGKFAAAGPP